MSGIVMSPDEIEAITQYRIPTMQLNELRRQGFFRARMGRRGVVLERGHYEAVVAARNEPPPFVMPEEPPAPLHWRQRPEHQARLRDEREAFLQQKKQEEATTRAAREQWEAVARELERTKPQRHATLIRFHASRRRVALLRRTPPWADQAAIRAVYAAAVQMKLQTGVEHHVDHVIPLQGALVSGLHVANNLQVLPWRENLKKRNHFEVDA